MSNSTERYEWYKAHGICPQCGQDDAASGRVFCLSCLDRRAIATIKYKAKNPERNKMDCRKRYAKAKANGICVRCFKNKARDGRVTCMECYAKSKKIDLTAHHLYLEEVGRIVRGL